MYAWMCHQTSLHAICGVVNTRDTQGVDVMHSSVKSYGRGKTRNAKAGSMDRISKTASLHGKAASPCISFAPRSESTPSGLGSLLRTEAGHNNKNSNNKKKKKNHNNNNHNNNNNAATLGAPPLAAGHSALRTSPPNSHRPADSL